MTDQTSKPSPTQPDAMRRRLTKGGLAAPVILATLASKPVLGAVPWKCTISGQLSGNVSGHESEVCSNLGKSPSAWVSTAVSSWPSAFKDGSNNPILFKNAPSSLLTKFADAFTGNVSGTDATVLEVLQGAVIVKGSSSATVLLGQEVVAAAMNALDGTNGYPAFPIPAADVVKMFNDLSAGGNYMTTDFGGVSWTAAQVIDYLNNLHP